METSSWWDFSISSWHSRRSHESRWASSRSLLSSGSLSTDATQDADRESCEFFSGARRAGPDASNSLKYLYRPLKWVSVAPNWTFSSDERWASSSTFSTLFSVQHGNGWKSDPQQPPSPSHQGAYNRRTEGVDSPNLFAKKKIRASNKPNKNAYKSQHKPHRPQQERNHQDNQKMWQISLIVKREQQ